MLHPAARRLRRAAELHRMNRIRALHHHALDEVAYEFRITVRAFAKKDFHISRWSAARCRCRGLGTDGGSPARLPPLVPSSASAVPSNHCSQPETTFGRCSRHFCLIGSFDDGSSKHTTQESRARVFFEDGLVSILRLT